MKLKIEIDLDNAAFNDPDEVGEILGQISEKFSHVSSASRLFTVHNCRAQDWSLMDSNGNRVGFYRITR